MAVHADTDVAIAARLVAELGGRFSRELGLDVDQGDTEVERWFIAATLFGARISAAVAERTFHVLDAAGLRRIDDARHLPWSDVVALLDEGGYARYDFRTASRLHDLSEAVHERYDGQVASIGRRFLHYRQLRDALDALPGWGPVTIEVFLREMRGVWPGARPPVDERAGQAARHLGLPHSLDGLARLARDAAVDPRDLESALVRLARAHRGGMDACPDGSSCVVLATEGGGYERQVG